MAPIANTHKQMILCVLCMAILSVLALPGSPFADSGKDGTAIRNITPMTEVATHGSNIAAEDYFDIVGLLNVLEDDRIVIGNSELTPASGLDTSGVKLSNTVGARVNGAGKVLKIVTIYDDPH